MSAALERCHNIKFTSSTLTSHNKLQCTMYIQKYADSGTRTNVVCLRRLLLARVQLTWLHTEICRQWDSNQRSLFTKAIASTRSTELATYRNMPTVGLEPTYHAFNWVGYIKKYADSGTRTNVVCLRRLLLARVQLSWLHTEICRHCDSNQCSLIPKATR